MFDAPKSKMKKRLIIPVFAIIIFKNGFSQNRSSAYDPCVADTFDLLNNKPFARLLLEDTAGQIFNTSLLAGKTIYVDFWFTSCSPCLREIPYSKTLQQFFASDTNIVFLNICIDNIERKQAWKQIINNKKMSGIHLFYMRNKPQKINLLKEYKITFPMHLLINKEMKIIGYDAPSPFEQGWVHWAIAEAEKNIFLSDSYRQLITHSKSYKEFIDDNLKIITSLTP